MAILLIFKNSKNLSEHPPEVAILILSLTSNTLLRLSGRFETTPIFVTKSEKIRKSRFFRKKGWKTGTRSLSLEEVCASIINCLSKRLYGLDGECVPSEKLIFAHFFCVKYYTFLALRREQQQVKNNSPRAFWGYLFSTSNKPNGHFSQIMAREKKKTTS